MCLFFLYLGHTCEKAKYQVKWREIKIIDHSLSIGNKKKTFRFNVFETCYMSLQQKLIQRHRNVRFLYFKDDREKYNFKIVYYSTFIRSKIL